VNRRRKRQHSAAYPLNYSREASNSQQNRSRIVAKSWLIASASRTSLPSQRAKYHPCSRPSFQFEQAVKMCSSGTYSTSTYGHIINGQTAFSEKTASVLNPATGLHLADVPILSSRQLDEAVDAAERAFPAWASKTYEQRGSVLQEMASIIEAHAGHYKELLTSEQGKPVGFLVDAVYFVCLTQVISAS
jgi:hypothetical protein